MSSEESRRARYEEAARALVLAFMTIAVVALGVGVVALANLVF